MIFYYMDADASRIPGVTPSRARRAKGMTRRRIPAMQQKHCRFPQFVA
jgi:hypothetical protein